MGVGDGVGGGSHGGVLGWHLEDDLAFVAHVDAGQAGVLGAPLGDVFLKTLVAGEEVVGAEMDEGFAGAGGKEGFDVFGVGQVDFAEVGGDFFTFGVEVAEEGAVEVHALFAGFGGVCGFEAGDDGKGVAGVAGGVGRNVEEDAGAVGHADGAALADKGDGDALGDLDAEAVGEEAHDAGVLDPGDLLELVAALGKGNAEDVLVDVLTEDAEELGAGKVLVAAELDVAGGGDEEVGIPMEKARGVEGGGGGGTEYGDRADGGEDTAGAGLGDETAADTAVATEEGVVVCRVVVGRVGVFAPGARSFGRGAATDLVDAFGGPWFVGPVQQRGTRLSCIVCPHA